jgi:hypothetical protein
VSIHLSRRRIDTGHQPDKQNLSNRNAETETSVKAPTHTQMGAINFLRPTVAGTRHFSHGGIHNGHYQC